MEAKRHKVPDRLETQRLILRQWQLDDWQGFHTYANDPEATRYTYGDALSEAQSWRMMASMAGHWGLHGYGPYALQEKLTNTMIGTVGYWYPVDWPEPEIKWALTRSCWGRGYASEAARAVLKAGQRYLPDIRWISFIHQNNEPSIALAKALDARWESTQAFRGDQFHVFRHQTGSEGASNEFT